MKKLLLLALSSILLFAASCNEDTVTDPVLQKDLAGTIKTFDNQMLVDAVIIAKKGSIVVGTDTTDDDGSFVLSQIPSDFKNMTMEVYHPAINKLTFHLIDFAGKISDTGNNQFLVQENDSCCGKLVVALRDSTTNQALENVKIRLNKANKGYKALMTNAQGSATFTNLCAGEYRIIIQKDGYKGIEATAVITNCEPLIKSFALAKRSETNYDSCCHGIISITVKDSSTNTALANIKIKAVRDGKIIKDGTTSANGSVVMTGFCPGEVRFVFNYNTREYAFGKNFGCNDTIIYTKMIDISGDCCTSKYVLQIKDSLTSLGLNGVKVKLFKGSTLLSEKLTSDTKVMFGDLCSGQYGVSISKDGYKSIEYNFNIDCPDSLFVTKYIAPKAITDTCCNGSVKVWLRDSVTYAAISNKTVKLIHGNTVIKDGKTNNDGFFVFTKICSGEYNVKIIINENNVITKGFNLECNQEKVIEAFYKTNNECHTAILKIRVKDTNTSLWLDSAEVKLYKENGTLVETVLSNAEGWAMFDNLTAPATYKVRVYLAGYKVREFTFTFNECKTIQETSSMETD